MSDVAGIIDERGQIQADVPCVGCEYNLRMLDAAGRCPECGKAIGFSMASDRLLFADPQWIAALRWGSLWALIGHGLFMPCLPLAGIFGFLYVTGYWLMTTREQGDRSSSIIRLMVRSGHLIFLALVLICYGAVLLNDEPKVGVAISDAIFFALYVAGLGVLNFTICMTLIYIQDIAKRMRHHGMATEAITMASVFMIALVALLVLSVMLPGIELMITGILMIWYFTLLLRLHLRLRAVRAIGEHDGA